MIVCFYIDCSNQAELERHLNDKGYDFYDATKVDPYTAKPGEYRDLTEIEAGVEGE